MDPHSITVLNNFPEDTQFKSSVADESRREEKDSTLPEGAQKSIAGVMVIRKGPTFVNHRASLPNPAYPKDKTKNIRIIITSEARNPEEEEENSSKGPANLNKSERLESPAQNPIDRKRRST